MPTYTAECSVCHRERDYFAKIASRNRCVPKCCGKRMQQIIRPTYVVDDIPAYVSPVTGKVIASRTARRDDLKRSRSRPYEGFDQESKEAARQRAYADQKLDKTLTDTAHKVWHELPSDKRRVLDGSE